MTYAIMIAITLAGAAAVGFPLAAFNLGGAGFLVGLWAAERVLCQVDAA